MRKLILMLLLATSLTHFASAQTQSLTAKWTPEQKVVLDALPAAGQSVILDVPSRLNHRIPELTTACEKMSDPISTWKLSENGSTFIITLHRDSNPQWVQKDWEMYIYRVTSAYLPRS